MGPIAAALEEDHRRLDELLARAVAAPPAIDQEAYEAFRAGLLRHIAIEEKVLFRESRAARGGQALPIVATLRVQHGALASLLVPTPTVAIAGELRKLL